MRVRVWVIVCVYICVSGCVFVCEREIACVRARRAHAGQGADMVLLTLCWCACARTEEVNALLKESADGELKGRDGGEEKTAGRRVVGLEDWGVLGEEKDDWGQGRVESRLRLPAPRTPLHCSPRSPLHLVQHLPCSRRLISDRIK